MTIQKNDLPHWDMTTIFTGLDDPAFIASFAATATALKELEQQFDTLQIQRHAPPLSLNDELVATFETLITKFNATLEQSYLLYAYVMGFVSTDSRHSAAQARDSELMLQRVLISQLDTRFTAWLGSLDVATLLAQSEVAQAHAYALHKAQIEAQHQMSPAEESLAAELNVTGSIAWEKLYNDFSSQITQTVEIEGELKTLPITAIRNLASASDRALRQRAYKAELAAWEAHAVPLAAAMNSIKGQMNTLNHKRGWDSPLDVALHNNSIDHETLQAMLSAAQSFFPDLRRYLKAKARALNVAQLAWYDLFAPIGGSERVWSYAAARDFILAEFNEFSPKLGALAKRAYTEQWIDAEPRDGKSGGAFCMWVRGPESRILTNFNPTYTGLSTLAHELGHAYHNRVQERRTYIQRQTPMTLAETASNFCEIIIREAALKDAAPPEQLAILEASLQDATQVLIDISSRYFFETAVFERRQQRELAVAEFNTLMLECQRATYGDGLDPEQLHPYMWAVKPHYYGSTFYNFPYMFGLLFSLGLYAHYQHNPATFHAHYDDLLSATGMADAATLAQRFDIDVHSPEFWHNSLTLIVQNIDRFEALVDAKI